MLRNRRRNYPDEILQTIDEVWRLCQIVRKQTFGDVRRLRREAKSLRKLLLEYKQIPNADEDTVWTAEQICDAADDIIRGYEKLRAVANA